MCAPGFRLNGICSFKNLITVGKIKIVLLLFNLTLPLGFVFFRQSLS